MKISEDSNLRFSYNITNPSSTIKKGINRDRQYVSRTVYQKDISKILENVDDETVLNKLVEQIERSYEDKVFLEDFEFELKETVSINNLDVNEKKVLEEVVKLLKSMDGLRGELYLLDNIIISKENIAYKNTKENSIVIPREALSTITSCSSSIIDAIASVRHASAQFKSNFIGEICTELFELKNKIV